MKADHLPLEPILRSLVVPMSGAEQQTFVRNSAMSFAGSNDRTVPAFMEAPGNQALQAPLLPRVAAQIPGRYMLEDRREHCCTTTDISPTDVALEAEVIPSLDERVVLYLQHLGRLEGRTVRVSRHGFALVLHNREAKQEKIGDHLTWLVNRHLLGRPQERRHERIVPIHTFCNLKMSNGLEQIVRLIDVSISGAAFRPQGNPLRRLLAGSHVELGSRRGRIVRTFNKEAVIEFDSAIEASEFDETIVL